MTSVRDAAEAFFRKHRLDRSGYDRRLFVVRLGPLALPFPNPGWLKLHDLHHVALDAPPTFWGEVEVSAFELRSGVPSALVGLLCVGALALGALVAPRRVQRAWRRYRHATNLYDRKYEDAYEDVLRLPIERLRRTLGVSSS